MLQYFTPFLFSIAKFGGVTFLFHTYLNTYHYDNYNSVLIICTYKSIFVLSNIQILCRKLYNRFDTLYKYILLANPSIAKYLIKDNNTKSRLEFVCDGYVNYVTSKANIIKDIINTDARDYDGYANYVTNKPNSKYNFNVFAPDVPFDFILYSDYDSKTKITNKVILEDFKNEFAYNNSDVSFILTEMIIEDKIIKVEFKTDNYNYFIENNKFTHAFLVYFMKTHYNKEIKEFEDKLDNMTLKIIDSDVIIETFDNKNALLICKENYKKIVI